MFNFRFDLVGSLTSAMRAVLRDPVLALSSAAVIIALSSVLVGLIAGIGLARRHRRQRALEARRAELAFMRLSRAEREKIQAERREQEDRREHGDRRERAGRRAQDRRPRPSLEATMASPRIRHHIELIQHRTQALLEMVEHLDDEPSAADVKVRLKRLHIHVSGLQQIAAGQAEWSDPHDDREQGSASRRVARG